ncbi:MAG: hypothetical protein AAGE85_14695 [Pseudomonadota bacterium]
MKKFALILALGFCLGGIVGYLLAGTVSGLSPESRFAAPPVRDLTDSNSVTVERTEALRKDRFSAIQSIEDTLALPSDFAETEALYVLAGRSNADELQDLIYQASRIRENQDRNYALGILLGRLTELDPRSAIAIAASPMLKGQYPHEREAWIAWARLDFEAALSAAKETSGERRNRVAQALYRSLREPDAARDRQILTALGRRPSMNTNAQRVSWLAETSPASAVAYIETLDSLSAQQSAVRVLASSLQRSGADNIEDVAQLLSSPVLRRLLASSIRYQAARRDPEALLSRLAAKGTLGQSEELQQALAAFGQLALSDPERARQLAEQVDGGRNRQVVQTVAAVLVQVDPAGALEWVRERDQTPGQEMLISVLTQMATDNPDLAMAEAQLIGNERLRERAVSNIVQTSASADPAKAAELLEFVSNPRQRLRAINQLAQQWSRVDLEGALAWQSRLPADEQQPVLQQMVGALLYSDPDAAISLLPRLDAQSTAGVASSVVGVLSQQRSHAEAMAFVERYRDQPYYDSLKMQALSSLAVSDPDRAMALLRSSPAGAERDQALTHVAQQAAGSDPRKALRWVAELSDENQRSQARALIANAWLQNDPVRALNWINSLPIGQERDTVLSMAAYSLDTSNVASATSLLGSIEDRNLRATSLANFAMQIYLSDPAAAERILNDVELPPEQRQQYLDAVRRQGRQSW